MIWRLERLQAGEFLLGAQELDERDAQAGAVHDRVRRFLKDYVAGLGLDDKDSLKVELALHEICVNVALYAYPKEPRGDMAVRLWREDGTLFIEVRDKGVPFNTVEKKNPNLLVKLRRGQPGGLGVYFYRTQMDGLSYRRIPARTS